LELLQKPDISSATDKAIDTGVVKGEKDTYIVILVPILTSDGLPGK